MSKLDFDLPVAPSLNNAFFNVTGHGRVKAAHYRHWLKAADDNYLLQALQRAGKITVSYACKMVFPKNLQGDLDGRAKAILDWMVSRNLTIDDSNCRKLLLEYGNWIENVVEIEVTPHDEPLPDRKPRPRSA